MSLAEEVSDPSTMGGLCYNCPTLGESVVLVQTIEHKLCFVDMSKVVIDTAINLTFYFNLQQFLRNDMVKTIAALCS